MIIYDILKKGEVMNIFNDKEKTLNWWNKNYFFVGTIAIVLLNIILFAGLGNDWASNPQSQISYSVLNFDNIVSNFLNCFEHSNWQHCLLNMLCFLIIGTYIERKKGTGNLFCLVLLFAIIGKSMSVANSLGGAHGFSGINYALYAFILIDYIFYIIKGKKSKINIIYGAIIIALIYVAMCYSGGTTGFAFCWYPYDLINNMGHYTGYLAGLIISLVINICKLQTKLEINK